MKRFLWVLVGMSVLVGSLYARGQGGREGSSAGPAVAREFPGGWKPTSDLSRRVDFTMATVQTIEGYNYTDGDPYVKWWSDAFNYRMDVTSLTFDNWAESLRIWINSGDMPDVAVFNYVHADMAGFVDQGLVKKFPDNWKTRWPNMARVFSRTALGPQMEQTFGGVYFMPRSRFDNNVPRTNPTDPLPDHIGFFYRKDWAQAVGFPVKTIYTPTEILQYAQLIKDRDPGRIGARLLPISSRAEWSWRFFVQSNFAHYRTFYKDKATNRYVWGPAQQEVVEPMKMWWRAWKAGLLNPDFYTVRDLEDYDQFRVGGFSGGYFGEGTVGHMYTAATMMRQAYPDIDPEKAIGFATVVGEDGYFHQEDLINFWGCIIFNPNISDEKFNRYMDMMDFQCSDAGYLFSQAGFEGVDYRRNADGSYVSLLPPEQRLTGSTGKYPGMSYVIAVAKLADDFSFENPASPKVWRDYSLLTYRERGEHSTYDTFTFTDWVVYTHDSPNLRKVPTDLSPEFTTIITSATSEADVEVRWRAWVERQRPLFQPVLDELNAKR
jgi:putative aldouronate transport system substrate-binding protein